MNCPECRGLYRIFEQKRARYVEARSAAFFQISTKIAVRRDVDLQRAFSDLQEHQAACPWAIVAQVMGANRSRIAHAACAGPV